MNLLLLILGILLVLIVYLDILQTTIQNNGAGLISSQIAKGLWKFFIVITKGNGKSFLLAQAGLIIIVFLILFWVLNVWIGYTLIFSFEENSLLLKPEMRSTTFLEKLYYAGYTLSTLGYGDIKASSDAWRILSVILSISGLFLLTLCITYLIPVLSAVTQKRKLSVSIYFLGKSPQDILLNGWNGNDLNKLNSHFNTLAQNIIDHREKHLLYPILHYFHSREIKYAIPFTLSVLDESISIINNSSFLKSKTDPLVISILQQSINEYFDVLEEIGTGRSKEAPPLPDLQKLEQKLNIDTSEIYKGMEKIGERRKLLKGMMKNDGWTWEEFIK